MFQSSTKVYLKLVGVMFFWGISFVSGRVLTQDYNPFSVAFFRFLMAATILLLFLHKKNPKFYLIDRWQFLKVLSLAFTGVFSYNFFFFNGLKLVEAGRSSIIIAMNPAVISLFAAIILREHFGLRKTLGVILAFVGVLLVICKGNFQVLFTGSFGIGELYLLGAVFSWVSYTLLGKFTLKKISPLEATTWAATLGCLLLFPFALQADLTDMLRSADLKAWLHVANIGVLATCFGFIWYYEGVRDIGAARASSFINLVPIFGVASGILFLNERPSWSLLLGGLIVILGVFLVNRSNIRPTS